MIWVLLQIFLFWILLSSVSQLTENSVVRETLIVRGVASAASHDAGRVTATYCATATLISNVIFCDLQMKTIFILNI